MCSMQSRNNKNRELHVLYQSDEGYAVPLCVSLYSMLKNNSSIAFTFHIINNGLKGETIDRITEIVSEWSASIDWIDAEEFVSFLKERCFALQRDSYTTYLKLFVVDRIISNYPVAEWLLYVDCDTLIVGNLEELLDLKPSEKYIYGVYEYNHPAYRQHIGVNGNSINAGMYLLHLNEWKNNGDGDKILSLLNDSVYISNLWLHDQDVINHLFADQICAISPRYNLTHAFCFCHNSDVYGTKFHMAKGFYSREEIEKSMADPVIIHYMDVCWTGMPWDRWNANQWTKLYIKYKNQCWNEGITVPKNKNVKRQMGKAVMVLVNKICPRPVKARIYYYISKMMVRKKIR